jgi:hypothetical protein
MSAGPIVLLSEIPKVDDFTTHLSDSGKLVSQLGEASKSAGDESKLAYDCDALITTQRSDGTLVTMEGQQDPRRIHACKCFKGSQWSLTIRQQGKQGVVEMPPLRSEGRSTNFAASSYVGADFLNSFEEICTPLYECIFEERKIGTTGLVIVTGGTGSGKSQVIRGLINSYLCDKENLETWFKRRRVPHLITYEDPIEKTLFGAERPELRLDLAWINYTPRQRGVDVSSLSNAINSALRQTPAAFYVGEVRDIKEWKLLLEFAGTGHLIFTTAHAGSLVEAMGKLFAATSSDTAARRAIVADRLAALVHLRHDQLVTPISATATTVAAPSESSESTYARNILIPSLWRHTMVGAKTLMAEGQSSLLPHAGKQSKDQSCFGRTYFCDRLSQLAQDASKRPDASNKPIPPQFLKDFRRRCTEWDLEGL